MKKLPAHMAGFVMPLVLSIFMTCVVSAISTYKTLGLAPDFVVRWLPAWGLSWLVAFPTLLLVLPLVRKIVSWVVEPA